MLCLGGWEAVVGVSAVGKIKTVCDSMSPAWRISFQTCEHRNSDSPTLTSSIDQSSDCWHSFVKLCC